MNLPTALQWLQGLIDTLFPPACLVCGDLVQEEMQNLLVCPSCYQKLEPFPANLIHTDVLHRLERTFLDDAVVAFRFHSTIQELIHLFKYQKMPGLARKLARLATLHVQNQLQKMNPEIIIPVPLHPSRQAERGYNQSTWIARGIRDILHIEVNTTALHRIKKTRTQTNLGRQERLENVMDAFAMRGNHLISGKNILLVDDVITTGATMNACARMLKERGVAMVIGFAISAAS